ncbi:ABC transporter, permease protein [Calothrix sp. PCC 7716]|nr:ABC transporter, permease protein [Calothrix sp. PCC 7716]
MVKYLIQRILISIPTLIAISIVIFAILALAPGDPMGEFALNSGITAEVRENIRRSLGLDQPTHIRYIKWVTAFISGDMGYSFTSRTSVSSLIFQRLPVTLWIVGSAYFLGTLLAVPLGVISALKRNSTFDMVLTTLVFFGFSLPTFFTSLLLIIIFSVQLKWLPFIYNSDLQVTDLNSFFELIKQSIMPIFVLGIWQTAVLMRFVRSEILENIHKDYVRTAYAKGLPHYIVIIRHVLRNALIPVVTLVALDIPSIFTGALVIEKVFRVPGIGALLIDSINSSDTPVVMSITFIYGILIVIFNLIADILYGLLDPRVSSTK